MKTTLTRAALYGLLAAAVTRRKVMHRRAYFESLRGGRLMPIQYRGCSNRSACAQRRHELRRCVDTWRRVHYAPARQVFLAELAALCNAHRFVVCQTEYDGPLEAVPMKRKAKRLTARTVLAQ